MSTQNGIKKEKIFKMGLSLEIGKRIREVRGSLSQADFAAKLKVGQSTIARYEKGTRAPDADFILLLKENYQINPNWLITGEGPKKNIQNGIDPNAQLSNITQVIIEHQDMIREFQDQEKAMEFNQFLVEIEKHDPEGYDELYREARSIFKTLKRIQQKDALKKTPKKADIQNGS
jgi:transcriptional regulator with XRE-family HTH domain